jgi:hypothetical protein
LGLPQELLDANTWSDRLDEARYIAQQHLLRQQEYNKTRLDNSKRDHIDVIVPGVFVHWKPTGMNARDQKLHLRRHAQVMKVQAVHGNQVILQAPGEELVQRANVGDVTLLPEDPVYPTINLYEALRLLMREERKGALPLPMSSDPVDSVSPGLTPMSKGKGEWVPESPGAARDTGSKMEEPTTRRVL